MDFVVAFIKREPLVVTAALVGIVTLVVGQLGLDFNHAQIEGFVTAVLVAVFGRKFVTPAQK